MNDKKTKCHKVKKPCKLCFQRVSHKDGLRCEGACKRWMHYKCLQYTPCRIADIKAGVIKVTCPCPDCVPLEPIEIHMDPPSTCSDTKCPVNQYQNSASPVCPTNMPGEGAQLYPECSGKSSDAQGSKTKGSKAHGSNEQSGALLGSLGSLPLCCRNNCNTAEPSSNNLFQPTSEVTMESPGASPDRSCKARILALKEKLSAYACGKRSEKQSPPQTSVCPPCPPCPPKTCSPPATAQPSPVFSEDCSPRPCNPTYIPSICKGRPPVLVKSTLKQIGSNQSTAKVQFKKTKKMDAPKMSKSFAGLYGNEQCPPKTKKTHNKMDCPVSTSDSVIGVCKGQDILVTALDEMRRTVGRLAVQIKDIMCKLDGVR